MMFRKSKVQNSLGGRRNISKSLYFNVFLCYVDTVRPIAAIGLYIQVYKIFKSVINNSKSN